MFRNVVVLTMMCLLPKIGMAAVKESILYNVRGQSAEQGNQNCPAGQALLPPLAEHRGMFGTAVFESKLFVIGGYTYSGRSFTSVQTFDGASWSFGPELPFNGERAVAVVFQSRLYVLGKEGAVVYLNGSHWTSAPPMPRPRFRFSAAVRGSKLYVLGDQNGAGKLVDAFDGKSWSDAPPLPFARDGLAAVTFEGKLYALGGEAGTDSYKTVEVFDGTRWSAAPSMLQDRSGLVAAVFNSKLYALGGMASGVGGRSSVEFFDGHQWTLAPSMTIKRSEFGGGVLGTKLYVLGGDDTGIFEAFDGTSFTRCVAAATAGWAPLGHECVPAHTSTGAQCLKCAGAPLPSPTCKYVRGLDMAPFQDTDCQHVAEGSFTNCDKVAPALQAACKDVVETCKGNSTACNVVSIWKSPSCIEDVGPSYKFCGFYTCDGAPRVDSKCENPVACHAFYTLMRESSTADSNTIPSDIVM